MKKDLEAMLTKHHAKLSAHALKKIWGYISGAEKPSKKTLDKLALLAGFQSWDDFYDALHGEDDAQVNYEGKN